MKRTGLMAAIDQKVAEELTKIKIEIRIDGKWVEVREDQLVDDPDDFKFEVSI